MIGHVCMLLWPLVISVFIVVPQPALGIAMQYSCAIPNVTPPTWLMWHHCCDEKLVMGGEGGWDHATVIRVILVHFLYLFCCCCLFYLLLVNQKLDAKACSLHLFTIRNSAEHPVIFCTVFDWTDSCRDVCLSCLLCAYSLYHAGSSHLVFVHLLSEFSLFIAPTSASLSRCVYNTEIQIRSDVWVFCCCFFLIHIKEWFWKPTFQFFC